MEGVVSKMQRFGLFAALSAGVAVVLVVVFLSAGPNPGGFLVGTWSLETGGDTGARITFEGNGTFRLVLPERVSEVVTTMTGTYQAQPQPENRLLLVRTTKSVVERAPTGEQEEHTVDVTEEWLLSGTTGDNLTVATLQKGKPAQRFRMTRVQE
jgi:hypothetical protein